MTAAKTIESEIINGHFHVVLFGSARLQKGTPEYEMVFELARRIGSEGYDIVTGGGPGLMDAAMSGHFEGRGKNHNASHEIGLQIRLPKEQEDSRHFDIKAEFSRFAPRLDTFITLANVAIVAPGGVGTLLELAYTWQLLQVRQSCQIPIILVGEMWQEFVEWVRAWPLKRELLSPEDLDLLFIAKDIDEAMEIIRREHEAFLRGETCANKPVY